MATVPEGLESPDDDERATSLLMSDERALLKDLQCYDEPASSESPKGPHLGKSKAPMSTLAVKQCP